MTQRFPHFEWRGDRFWQVESWCRIEVNFEGRASCLACHELVRVDGPCGSCANRARFEAGQRRVLELAREAGFKVPGRSKKR